MRTRTTITRTTTYRQKGKGASLFILLLWLAAYYGYVRCWYQFCTSDFEPIGKREWVYGVGCFTYTGVILGYFNISDTHPTVTPITNAGKIPANPVTDTVH